MALLITDDVTRTLEPRFETAAKAIRDALLEGRPVWVRFDRDADGTSGGLLVSQALRAFKAEHASAKDTPVRLVSGEGALYTAQLLDIDNSQLQFIDSDKKPVVLFIDHAGNPDSAPQLDALRNAGCFVIVADHHPVPLDVFSHMDVACDPYSIPAMDRKGSAYTGGYLAFEIARRVHPSVEKPPYARIPYWSFQADKSPFATPDVEHKEPTVLDYYCTTIDSPAMLGQVEERIFNQTEVDYTFEKAMRAVDEAALEALGKHVTEETLTGKAGLVLCTLSFDFRKNAWPSKSRLMNVVSTALYTANAGKPVVLIGYGDDKVSFRANMLALDAGFRSNDFIQPAKTNENLGPLIISGGGHDAAAAMLTTPNKARHVAKSLANQIREKFNH